MLISPMSFCLFGFIWQSILCMGTLGFFVEWIQVIAKAVEDFLTLCRWLLVVLSSYCTALFQMMQDFKDTVRIHFEWFSGNVFIKCYIKSRMRVALAYLVEIARCWTGWHCCAFTVIWGISNWIYRLFRTWSKRIPMKIKPGTIIIII